MGIYKRKDMWYVDYVRHGKRVRKPVSCDKRIAEQALRNELVDIDRNNAGIPIKITLTQLIDQYLSNGLATKKESTYTRDKVCLKEFSKLINTEQKLSQLAPVIRKHLDDCKSSKLSRGCNPFTLNILLRTVKAMFNKAFKWNYLNSNPLAGFELARVPKNPRIRVLSNEEITRLLDCCDQELKDIVLTFIFSGLRAAELLFLEWVDVDFNRNVIKIQQKDIWIPKTYESREIPIHPYLKRVLLRCKLINKGGFIFCKDSGNREAEQKKRKPTQGSSYRILYRHYQEALTRAGIENVKLHTLRHTFGSHCAMDGIDVSTIKEYMGHSDIKTTMIYVHPNQKHMNNSIAKLDYDSIGKREDIKSWPH